ncbi:hypothetical protein Droror1_Dr00027507 [Drosera rotundifolia]
MKAGLPCIAFTLLPPSPAASTSPPPLHIPVAVVDGCHLTGRVIRAQTRTRIPSAVTGAAGVEWFARRLCWWLRVRLGLLVVEVCGGVRDWCGFGCARSL